MNKKINIDITLRRDGGLVKRSRFAGFAFVEAGFLTGTFLEENVLDIQERVLLTAFTFTGCPVAARSTRSNLNPWELTNGGYQGTREMKSDQFISKSTIESVATPQRIDMRLNLEVDGCIDEIRTIGEPFQEVIIETGLGSYRGSFEVKFRTRNGGSLISRATSRYTLNVNEHFAPVWRNITIINSDGNGPFRQVEQIDLFGDQQEARDDLSEKLAVANT